MNVTQDTFENNFESLRLQHEWITNTTIHPQQKHNQGKRYEYRKEIMQHLIISIDQTVIDCLKAPKY